MKPKSKTKPAKKTTAKAPAKKAVKAVAKKVVVKPDNKNKLTGKTQASKKDSVKAATKSTSTKKAIAPIKKSILPEPKVSPKHVAKKSTTVDVKEKNKKPVQAPTAKPSDAKQKAEAGKKTLLKLDAPKPKRGRKKKGDKDDDEENVVIEHIEIVPDPALIPKKYSQKDKAKERILNKLREKQQSEVSKRNFLPTKKKKYTLEYIIKSSPIILWDFITTSSGLGLWFADEVDDHLDIFTFTWEGNKQQAEVMEYEDLEYIRFRWVDNPYDEYFEFRITSTEITGDTVLLITDFAEQYELRDVQLLWDSQIKNLMMRMGLGN